MELSEWAIQAIEEQIAARGEATHYEPLRREEIGGRAPAAARLAWFNACAQAEGYRITRSEKTGGIVIRRRPEDEIAGARTERDGTLILAFPDASEVSVRTVNERGTVQIEWHNDTEGRFVDTPRARAARAWARQR